MHKLTPNRTAATALVEQLLINGVEHVFCVPGESFLPVLDALRDSGITKDADTIGAVVEGQKHDHAAAEALVALAQEKGKLTRKEAQEAARTAKGTTRNVSTDDAADGDTRGAATRGVGAPGAIDDHAGTLARAGNLPGWRDPYPLAGELGARLGTAIRMGNDVQVATDAEFTLGAAREYSSLLGVFWGTGVGGGIVLDGRPWIGRGAAGEIGHVVVKDGGARCPCGRRGKHRRGRVDC